MRRILACIIGILCICSAAWAQHATIIAPGNSPVSVPPWFGPSVTATVSVTSESVTYNYRFTNTTLGNIFEFDVYAPGAAASDLASFTTSQQAWWSGISRASQSFVCISWSGTSATPLAPGASADFSFTTAGGVPTMYSYTFRDTGVNWRWSDGFSYWGNTILPVPAPIPEPSSFVALAGGLVSLLAVRRRGRK